MRRHLTPFTLIAGIAVLSFGGMVTFVLAVSQLEEDKPIEAIPVLSEAVLPDGTILALNAVTYGSSHQIEVMVNRRHFDPFQSPWRWRRLDRHSGNDEVVIWLSRRDPDTGEFLDFDWWLRSEVTDSFGQIHVDDSARWEVVSAYGGSSSGGKRPFTADTSSHRMDDRIIVVSSELPKFRSSSNVDLDIINAEGDKVATLKLPNPTPQPTAEWEPEELPISKKDGDLEVVVKSVKSTKRKAKRNDKEYVRVQVGAGLDTLVDGKPSKDWNAHLRGFYDILGNEGRSWEVQLSEDEPAWRLEVEAYRRDTAPFAEDEIVEVGPIELQKSGRFDLKSHAAGNDDTDVEVRAVAAGGRVVYRLSTPHSHNSSYNGGHQITIEEKDGKERRNVECNIEWEERSGRATVTVLCELPHVLLEVDSQLNSYRLTVRAVDDKGRPVKVHMRQHYNAARFCFLEAEPDAREVTLDVIAHEPRIFEYFVKPPVPEWPEDRAGRGRR